ncbi:cytochrome c oxidase assembly protein subunit 11 [Roseovarius halotolerans]|uniref:Cytochrome c oxidase assembly protein CtaG n=1 Tax=Roseovarius halotolerans TaxID=505353 RepID=A0A1X6ZMI1_9RHOB|nr:cytochrome c oxidase assembly protein [Roseovarius halotolerans]RKT28232.1 cytochrome c oxidase assembly protein subunit 11 [Roseovarius halotolerans]SLN55393.1 Cytochrome c oxidase assembly protein CtaG [Roseovarius halotolerans]
MKLNGINKTVVSLVAVVLTMGALGWASVPLYDWFCRVTGYGGETSTATAGSDEILERTVKVRFDASKERGFPWEFKPMQREMELRIGETGLAFYEAYNPTDHPIAGQSSYNVTPFEAGSFFTKIDCFCFTEQILQPGERVEMPVTFYVDPEMVDDRDAKLVHTITLSYTFYEIDMPEDHAALDRTGETEIKQN